MLSRIAESLYWLGRYVERAEDAARILDVHYHLLLEDRWVDEGAAGGSLLAVMGLPARDPATTDSVLVTRILAFDHEYPGSIVRSLEAAWENARGCARPSPRRCGNASTLPTRRYLIRWRQQRARCHTPFSAG